MKKTSNLKLGLAALFICTSITAMADDSLTWHSYMRTGMGFSSDKAVEATNINQLGRAGNETDTYIASSLTKKIEGKDGAWADVNLSMIASLEDPENTGREFYALTGDAKGAFYLGESNVVFGGLDFLPKGATLKFGNSGFNESLGALDINIKSVLGTGVFYNSNNANKFQLAFLVNEYEPSINTGVYGMQFKKDTEVKTKLIHAEYSVGKIDTTLTVAQKLDNSNSAVTGSIAYTQYKMLGILPGFTKYTAQISSGAGAYPGTVGLVMSGVDDVEGTSAYRFIVDGHGNLGKLSLNPVLLTEGVNYGDDNTKESYSTISAGAKVMQPITKNLQMVYEGFVNVTKIKVEMIQKMELNIKFLLDHQFKLIWVNGQDL